MSAPTEWTVTPQRWGRVSVTGPGIDDLVHAILTDLADSIHDGDGRADAWADYLLHRSRLRQAVEDGADETEIERVTDEEAGAWDALEPELANAVFMRDAQARILAGALDEACGRVGTRRQP